MDKAVEKQILEGHLVQAEQDVFLHNLQKREAEAVKAATPEDSPRKASQDAAIEELDFQIRAAEVKRDLLQEELKAY